MSTAQIFINTYHIWTQVLIQYILAIADTHAQIQRCSYIRPVGASLQHVYTRCIASYVLGISCISESQYSSTKQLYHVQKLMKFMEISEGSFFSSESTLNNVIGWVRHLQLVTVQHKLTGKQVQQSTFKQCDVTTQLQYTKSFNMN